MANTREVSILLPEPVVRAAAALAEKESRTVSDLMQELVMRYERVVKWNELNRYGQERAEAKGIRTEDDVVRVCREVRAEQYEKSQVVVTGERFE